MSKNVLPELTRIEWTNRQVHSCYDSDIVRKPNVRAAESALCAALASFGAIASYIRLPEPFDLDDFLVKHKRADFDALPRVPFSIRDQLTIVRRTKSLSARERNEQISAMTIADMKSKGISYQSPFELYYFSEQGSTLLSLQDVQFRAFLNDVYGLNGSEQEFKYVIEDLIAEALRNGLEAEIYKFAHYDTDNGRLYIAHGDNHLLRIGSVGHEVVPNGTDGVLIRADRHREQIPIGPRPSNKALQRILKMPNFRGGEVLTAKQEHQLYSLTFWSLFFPELLPTRPIMLLVGPKGSSKTSSARAILQTLFGPKSDVTKADGEREDALATALTNRYVVALDNVDGHIAWLANLLATAATGGSIARRVLYTTNDLAEYPIDCYVFATSRDPKSFKRDDVVDRLLVLSCSRRSQFIPESAILAKTEADRPAIWRTILNTLSKIIVALQDTSPTPVAHRLADFANFAYRIGPVLGIPRSETERLFAALEQERTEFTLQHSDVLQALVYWAESKNMPDSVTLTTGELYRQAALAWPGVFPFHKPATFGRALLNERTALEGYFSVRERRVGGNRKELTIKPKIAFHSIQVRRRAPKF